MQGGGGCRRGGAEGKHKLVEQMHNVVAVSTPVVGNQPPRTAIQALKDIIRVNKANRIAQMCNMVKDRVENMSWLSVEHRARAVVETTADVIHQQVEEIHQPTETHHYMETSVGSRGVIL